MARKKQTYNDGDRVVIRTNTFEFRHEYNEVNDLRCTPEDELMDVLLSDPYGEDSNLFWEIILTRCPAIRVKVLKSIFYEGPDAWSNGVNALDIQGILKGKIDTRTIGKIMHDFTEYTDLLVYHRGKAGVAGSARWGINPHQLFIYFVETATAICRKLLGHTNSSDLTGLVKGDGVAINLENLDGEEEGGPPVVWEDAGIFAMAPSIFAVGEAIQREAQA